MMEIIATGKTVDLAIEQACTELGVSRDDVNVEVLEVEVRKLFKTIPAKVRVTYGEEESNSTAVSAKSAAKEQAIPVAEKAKERKDPPKREGIFAKHEATKKPEVAKKPETAKPEQKRELKNDGAALPATGEKAEAAVLFIKEVVAAMGVEVDAISAVKQGEATIVRVEGEKVGALIGRRGETMEALSYLAGLVANRTGGDYEKIGLDVAGYRSKREQDLALLAKRIGSRVQKTGRSQMLEPMNPYERRIIHSVIGEMENLSSESTGEGANRRVVVRSTAAGATDGGEGEQRPLRSNNNRSRGTRGGRGGSSRASGAAPRKDAPAAAFTPRRKDAPMPKQDRPERKAPTGEAPVAVERSTTIDDSFDLPLYGKIEF